MANINLSQRDIDYIARVVDTEVPRSLAQKNIAEYNRMVNAVVDTVTNRMASGVYPSTAVGVLNQNRQFSKITGPSILDPYGSVQNTPRAPDSVRNMVADRIAGAAVGEPSEIGGALSYANPNFSSPSNLNSWVNPMIDAGAVEMGVGQNVHYHGLAPGQQAVGSYGILAEGIPNGNIPTPTDRNAPLQTSAGYGLMAAIDPVTPGAVQRGGLLADPRSVPSLSYPSTAPTMAAYSPAKTAPEQLSQQAAAPSFDMGRFGPAPTQPAQDPATIGFDPGRFGVIGPEAVGLAGLKQGLIDQQLNEGILPALTPDPVTTAATPGYVDPQVTTQKTARVQDPQVAQPARALSPEQQALRDAGGILQAQSTPGLAAANAQAMSQRNLTGGLLGGLAGGVLLGPVGALLGGLLGKNYAQKTYYPSAPANPNMTPQQQKANKNGGNGGFGGLSDYGRSVAGSSGQFSSAVSSGKSGLW